MCQLPSSPYLETETEIAMPLYIKSASEIAAEENADKLEAMEKARLKRFVDGLNSLTSLGISDDRDRLSTKAEYAKHAEAELRKLMRTTATADPGE
ncbi:MAG: hypothetical protein ACREQL_09370 [Candidatus Binatia bacterium]